MQINYTKSINFGTQTNKGGEGGGGRIGVSNRMRSQLTTAPILLRTFEDNESSNLKGVS